MKNIPQIYFTIGEFAKLCGVGKQTLYHYDKMGIFSPEITKENNYRYYSYKQLEVFFAINILKEIGMSLKDIKKYLDKRNPNELINLLEKEKEVINNKIAKLNYINSFIDKKIEATKSCLDVDINDIKITYLEEEHFLATKLSSDYDGNNLSEYLFDSFNEHFSNHFDEAIDIEIESCNLLGTIINYKNIKNKKYFNYSYIYTKLYDNYTKFSNYTKTKGYYLVCYHKGSYYNTEISYKKILKFIEKNNISTQGDFFEEVILDDLSVKGFDNYIIKIMIKVNI